MHRTAVVCVAWMLALPVWCENSAVTTEEALQLARESRLVASRGNLENALELNARARSALLVQGRDPNPGTLRIIAFLEEDAASYFNRLGRPEEALRMARSAVDSIVAAGGMGSAEHGALALTLGNLYAAAGQFPAALTLLEKSWQWLANGSQERRARCALSLARLLQTAARPGDALMWADRGLELQSVATVRLALAAQRISLLIELGASLQARTELAQLNVQTPAASLARDELAAALAFAEGRLADAEARLKAVLEVGDESVHLWSAGHLAALSRLGHIYILTGRPIEAQTAYRTLLSDAVRAGLSPNHPLVGRTLHALAITYKDLGEYEEAELLYNRALSVLETSLGRDTEAVARTRMEFSRLLGLIGNHAAAEREADTAITVLEKRGSSEALALAYATLAFAKLAGGQHAAAQRQFADAVEQLEAAAGPHSPDLPPGLLALGELSLRAGNSRQADAYADRAIDILQKMGTTSGSVLAKAWMTKAHVSRVQNRSNSERYADLAIETLSNRLVDATDQRLLAEMSEARHLFEAYLELLAPQLSSATVRKKLFHAAQFPTLSPVSASITSAAARGRGHSPRLATLLEERTRLAAQLVELERARERRAAGLAEADTLEHGAAPEDTRVQLQEIYRQLREEFPDFAGTAFPRPVDIAKTQRQLGADEAVLTMLTTDSRIFLFLVRRDSLTVRVSRLTRAKLHKHVNEVRRSISLAQPRPPPFAMDAAHQLYRETVGLFEEEKLRGVRHLIYVPDDALVAIPWGLLVTSMVEVKDRDYRIVPFLHKRLALSTLPSLSAFAALREVERSAQGAHRMLGIGQPLVGTAGPPAQERGGLGEIAYDVHADLEPLDVTRLEIETIADGFSDAVTLLAERATEKDLRRLSDLRAFGVIVFATHGLLRDDAPGITEPALVMTRDNENDGLLRASEIASLSLNADWVVLSACNTAGPDGKPRSRGLSGLAKAFFIAGARGLLVSHWAVNSSAAVLITTSTFATSADGAEVSKAQAFRAALTRFMRGDHGTEATHPAYWAPFVLVGDGGRMTKKASTDA